MKVPKIIMMIIIIIPPNSSKHKNFRYISRIDLHYRTVYIVHRKFKKKTLK